MFYFIEIINMLKLKKSLRIECQRLSITKLKFFQIRNSMIIKKNNNTRIQFYLHFKLSI